MNSSIGIASMIASVIFFSLVPTFCEDLVSSGYDFGVWAYIVGYFISAGLIAGSVWVMFWESKNLRGM